MLLGHRQAFTWIDEWIEMSYEDVREYEKLLQSQTNVKLSGKADSQEETPPVSENVSENNGQSSNPTSPKSPAKRGFFPWS